MRIDVFWGRQTQYVPACSFISMKEKRKGEGRKGSAGTGYAIDAGIEELEYKVRGECRVLAVRRGCGAESACFAELCHQGDVAACRADFPRQLQRLKGRQLNIVGTSLGRSDGIIGIVGPDSRQLRGILA